MLSFSTPIRFLWANPTKKDDFVPAGVANVIYLQKPPPSLRILNRAAVRKDSF